MGLKSGLYAIINAEGEDYDDYSMCLGAAYAGEMSSQSRDLFLGIFLEWLDERYSEEQAAERSFHISFYTHGIAYKDFKKPTEMEMLRLMRKSEKMTHDQREMLDFAVAVANDIRQIVEESDKQIPNPADANATTKTLITALHRRGTKTNFDAVIRAMFEQCPETKAFNSERLLLYLRGFAKKQDIEITITSGRLRQLAVWKENKVHRESGKTQYRENMDDIADESAEDDNDDDNNTPED